MMYKAKVAVCSDIRTTHSTQSDGHVEFFMLNLVVHKETARLNPLKTKRRLLYLKTQFVPRSKHFSSRL